MSGFSFSLNSNSGNDAHGKFGARFLVWGEGVIRCNAHCNERELLNVYHEVLNFKFSGFMAM